MDRHDVAGVLISHTSSRGPLLIFIVEESSHYPSLGLCFWGTASKT